MRSVALASSLCALLFLAAGCATNHPANPGAGGLAELLTGLGYSVNRTEAAHAADTACSYSLELSKQYRVIRPAILHNVLVNTGIRTRGLCFQWADDLSAKLTTLNLQTLQVRRGVARLNTRREHSCVVLTALGQPFDQGIVLDAWRHSGRLFWCGVQEDKYPWIEVEVVTSQTTP
jgi:hypothetical protein